MAITEIDEKMLVRAYQAGNERAFDTIVRTQYQALYAHAFRRLSDHESAEDAVQDTLLRAYRALPNLDGDLALRAWLHRILTNVCHDEGNRRRRQQGLVEKVGAMPEERAPDPADEAMVFDTVRLMAAALDGLPESYREALVLRYVDGLSFREIAQATGTTEENARARAHRGRLTLNKLMSRVAMMLAFIIPGLRRTQETPSSGAEQAVSSGMSEHTVNLATQLTTHAMTAAPTVSRFAEVASALPGGKSTLAAAAVTAVAAVAAPVAYTVNEVRKPERPPAAVAAPAATTTTVAGSAAVVAAVEQVEGTTTTTTLPASQLHPFAPLAEGTTTTSVPKSPTTTTTVAPPVTPGPVVEGQLSADQLTLTGAMPQWDVAGQVVFKAAGKTHEGSVAGRIYVYADDSASADDLVVSIEDDDLVLRFRGKVVEATTTPSTVTQRIDGTYVFRGASAYGLPDRGTVTITFTRPTSGDGTASLAVSFRGQGS